MKKIFSALIMIMVITLSMSACGDNSVSGNTSTESYAEDSLLYGKMQYLYQYAEKYDIPLPQFSERIKVANTLTQSNYDNQWENLVYVSKNPAFFKEDSYTMTVEETDYVYWGELNKDGRPDGIGILYQYLYDLSDLNPQLLVMYMGEFSDGFYDGYGVEFNFPDIDADYSMFIASIINEENIYMFNDPVYEGEFEEGRRSGIGTEIIWNYGAYDLDTGENLLNPEETDFTLFIGDFVKNEMEGEIKLYDHKGVIEYEGGYKNGDFNGKGKFYYVDYPGMLMYEGEFGAGEFYGQGTLYDETGKVIHEGKFDGVSPYEFLSSRLPESLDSDSVAEGTEESNTSVEDNHSMDDSGENYLTGSEITDILNNMIVERLQYTDGCQSAEITSIIPNEEYKIYDCITEFTYENCLISANIILDYQGELAGATIEEDFEGTFNQEHYDEFCQTVACVAMYFNEGMWNETRNVLPIEAESDEGHKEAASDSYNAYYSFDYDLVNENWLRFQIVFPMG